MSRSAERRRGMFVVLPYLFLAPLIISVNASSISRDAKASVLVVGCLVMILASWGSFLVTRNR